MTYRLVNADGHVVEPPGVWVDRVPAALVDRVPRMERFDDGDAWVIEGVADPINFGWNACAGLPPAQMSGWMRFDDVRPGGHDPAARIEEMDADGVDAEVLYPTPRLSQAIFATRDTELHLACIRAYNDWLSEFCAHSPDRFIGMALLPNCGAADAVAEIDRVVGRPGMRSVTIGRYPSGALEPSSEDDPVWDRLASAAITLNIHVSLATGLPSAHRSPLPGYGRFFDAPNRIVQMIFAGVFDRFPALAVVFAETDFGWVPYFKEQIDNNFRRLAATSNFTIEGLPSDYVERHVHFTYMTDNVGLLSLDAVGADRVMWSSDYPHISADWPLSWRTIQASTAGLRPADRRAVLAGNACRLYGLSA